MCWGWEWRWKFFYSHQGYPKLVKLGRMSLEIQTSLPHRGSSRQKDDEHLSLFSYIEVWVSLSLQYPSCLKCEAVNELGGLLSALPKVSDYSLNTKGDFHFQKCPQENNILCDKSSNVHRSSLFMSICVYLDRIQWLKLVCIYVCVHFPINLCIIC